MLNKYVIMNRANKSVDLELIDTNATMYDWLECLPKLKFFVASRVNDMAMAEDVVQETLFRTYKSSAVTQVQSPLAYLITVAKSVIAEKWRKDKNLAENVLTEDLQDQNKNPEQQYFDHAKLNAMLGVLENMPPLRRQVFKMRRIDGLSREQIAEQLGLQSEAVKKHITRAMLDITLAAEQQGWNE